MHVRINIIFLHHKNMIWHHIFHHITSHIASYFFIMGIIKSTFYINYNITFIMYCIIGRYILCENIELWKKYIFNYFAHIMPNCIPWNLILKSIWCIHKPYCESPSLVHALRMLGKVNRFVWTFILFVKENWTLKSIWFIYKP